MEKLLDHHHWVLGIQYDPVLKWKHRRHTYQAAGSAHKQLFCLGLGFLLVYCARNTALALIFREQNRLESNRRCGGSVPEVSVLYTDETDHQRY